MFGGKRCPGVLVLLLLQLLGLQLLFGLVVDLVVLVAVHFHISARYAKSDGRHGLVPVWILLVSL